MSETGYATFDTTIEKTNQVLKQIEEAYGWPKQRRQQSYDALRAVLHAVHRFVTPGEWGDIESTLPKDLDAVIGS